MLRLKPDLGEHLPDNAPVWLDCSTGQSYVTHTLDGPFGSLLVNRMSRMAQLNDDGASYSTISLHRRCRLQGDSLKTGMAIQGLTTAGRSSSRSVFHHASARHRKTCHQTSHIESKNRIHVLLPRQPGSHTATGRPRSVYFL